MSNFQHVFKIWIIIVEQFQLNNNVQVFVLVLISCAHSQTTTPMHQLASSSHFTQNMTFIKTDKTTIYLLFFLSFPKWLDLIFIFTIFCLAILSIICSVTGNANFRMNQTSLTMFTFTQFQIALTIIEDVQTKHKGVHVKNFVVLPRTCLLQDVRHVPNCCWKVHSENIPKWTCKMFHTM